MSRHRAEQASDVDAGAQLEQLEDPHPVLAWLTAPRRAWVQRVVVTAAPLLTAYGIASEQDAVLWVALVLALVGSVPDAARVR